MSRTRLVLAALALIVLAALAGFAVRQGLFGGDRPATGAVAVGGPFQLVDQNGRPTDEKVLRGKWSALFFGFTYCPEACPTTLLALRQAETLLGPSAKDLQTVFISVDPARDTPSQLRSFLANDAFPKHVVGLTGTPEQVDKTARAYHVFYAKDGQGSDYLVNHSTMTYLMNPTGRFVCVIPYGLTPEQMAERIRKAMRAGRDAEAC